MNPRASRIFDGNIIDRRTTIVATGGGTVVGEVAVGEIIGVVEVEIVGVEAVGGTNIGTTTSA